MHDGQTAETALAIGRFPALDVGFSILGQIMTSGIAKLNEAGIALHLCDAVLAAFEVDTTSNLTGPLLTVT